MVTVLVKNTGEGIWRPMTLPMTAQAAQTVAAAATQLQVADQVQITHAGESAHNVDLRV